MIHSNISSFVLAQPLATHPPPVSHSPFLRPHLIPRKRSSSHGDHLLLELGALVLQRLDRLQEQLVAVPLARTLYREDEVVPLPPQLHFALELLVPQALPAHRVPHRIPHHSLDLALFPLVAAALPRRLLPRDLVEPDDPAGKTRGELLGVGPDDGLHDVDGGHQAVRGGGDGRELGVVGADALVHVHGELDGLARPHLGDQDVRVHRGDGVVAREVARLVALRVEDDVAGVDVRVVVQLGRIVLTGGSLLVLGAFDVERQAHRVEVEGGREGVLARLRGPPPLEELAEALLATLEGDEAKAVRQDLILNDGGVVLNKDLLNGESGYLGDQYAPKGIGDGGVDADQREGSVKLLVVVELDSKPFPKSVDIPRMIFARIVTGEIGRGAIGDRF